MVRKRVGAIALSRRDAQWRRVEVRRGGSSERLFAMAAAALRQSSVGRLVGRRCRAARLCVVGVLWVLLRCAAGGTCEPLSTALSAPGWERRSGLLGFVGGWLPAAGRAGCVVHCEGGAAGSVQGSLSGVGSRWRSPSRRAPGGRWARLAGWRGSDAQVLGWGTSGALLPAPCAVFRGGLTAVSYPCQRRGEQSEVARGRVRLRVQWRVRVRELAGGRSGRLGEGGRTRRCLGCSTRTRRTMGGGRRGVDGSRW